MKKLFVQSILVSTYFTALNYFLVTQDTLRLTIAGVVGLLTSLFFITKPLREFKNQKVIQYSHLIFFSIFLPISIIYKDLHPGALHGLLIISCLKIKEINN